MAAAVRAIAERLNGLTAGRLLVARWGWGIRRSEAKRATSQARLGLRRKAAQGPSVRPEQDDYERAGIEPRLDEMLRDPIVQSIMRADGVEPAEVRRVLKAPDRRRRPLF